jgi:hypothetical protein
MQTLSLRRIVKGRLIGKTGTMVRFVFLVPGQEGAQPGAMLLGDLPQLGAHSGRVDRGQCWFAIGPTPTVGFARGGGGVVVRNVVKIGILRHVFLDKLDDGFLLGGLLGLEDQGHGGVDHRNCGVLAHPNTEQPEGAAQVNHFRIRCPCFEPIEVELLQPVPQPGPFRQQTAATRGRGLEFAV